MITRLLIVDNNCLNALCGDHNRRALAANLRAAGWDFWPTAMNVLEAVSTTDPNRRLQLLRTLAELSGDCHAFPLPTMVLEEIARAHHSGADRLTLAEPRFTALFRDPEALDETEFLAIRDYLRDKERRFDSVHARAKDDLKERLLQEGGRERWPDVGSFLDDAWSTESHLDSYFEGLWHNWGLPEPTPIADLLSNDAWRLYFDGWGAALYARVLQHPQPRLVQAADLEQLTYLGVANASLLLTQDVGFRDMARAITSGRYRRRETAPLDEMIM